MNPPEGHDLTGALQLATALSEARTKRHRILADNREHELAAELVARISARVAAATGATPPDVVQPGQAGSTQRGFSTIQVAEILGWQPNERGAEKVRLLIKNGKLRARAGNGKSYIISREAIDEYLDGADDPLRSAS